MNDLLVRDAELVVTMHGDDIPGGWVSVSNGTVTGVGRAGSEPAAATVLSARGSLVTPGLINTHHHIYQNLTRAFTPALNVELFDWLRILYPVWAALDEEAIEVSTWVGLAELALGGCTTTTDMLYVHPRPNFIDAEIRAARAVGLRFHPTRGSMSLSQKDGGLPPDSVVQTDEEILQDCERAVLTYHDPSPGAMVRIALAPCSPFSVTPRLLRETAELAERLDVRLHTHLAEARDEDAFCLERFGRRPIEQFEHVGWGGDRAWVAHCIFPDDDEIKRMGRWGTGVAHCPASTMLIGAGTTRVADMRAAGVPVGLGCDGSASTDHASLWLEARTALLVAKARGGSAAMSAREILEVATVGSAACLGRQDELGPIRAGAPADLVVWELDEIAFAGAHTDLVEAWLRCGPVKPRHTIVNGNAIVRDGRLTLRDTGDMLAAHARISRRLQSVSGLTGPTAESRRHDLSVHLPRGSRAQGHRARLRQRAARQHALRLHALVRRQHPVFGARRGRAPHRVLPHELRHGRPRPGRRAPARLRVPRRDGEHGPTGRHAADGPVAGAVRQRRQHSTALSQPPAGGRLLLGQHRPRGLCRLLTPRHRLRLVLPPRRRHRRGDRGRRL